MRKGLKGDQCWEIKTKRQLPELETSSMSLPSRISSSFWAADTEQFTPGGGGEVWNSSGKRTDTSLLSDSSISKLKETHTLRQENLWLCAGSGERKTTVDKWWYWNKRWICQTTNLKKKGEKNPKRFSWFCRHRLSTNTAAVLTS